MARLAYVTKKFGPAALAKIDRVNGILDEYASMGYDLTLRQVYYQHVARGYVANKQSEYNNLGKLINDARLAGYIDWDRIVDRTRFVRSVSHWDSPSDVIYSAARGYHEDLWANQDWYLNVWIEKDALVGVIENVCKRNDVPFFSCRGYVSQSEMWSASRRFLRALDRGKKVCVLHLGDHDPSGIDMTRDIDERLFLFLAVDHWRNKMEGSGSHIEASIEYVRDNFKIERLALNMDQVEQYDPPENPAKLTDSRASGYIAEHGYSSWELDALPPDALGELIEDAIFAHRDADAWHAAVRDQEKRRELLTAVSKRWGEVEEFLS